jgi:hypothetical protein
MRKVPAIAGVLLACALSIPASASAGVPVATTVSVKGDLPAKSATSVGLSCPRGRVAVAGAVQGPGLNLRASHPGRGARSWRFTLSRVPGADVRTFQAHVRCVGIRLPFGVRRAVLRVSERAQSVRGGPLPVQTRLTCPGGQVPTGWGFVRRRQGDWRLNLRGVERDARGWRFSLSPPAFGGGGGTFKVSCLGAVQTARRDGRSVRHRFEVTERRLSDSIAGATGGVQGACRTGEASLMPGFALGGEGLAIGQLFFDGRRGAGLTATNDGAGGDATLSVPCLSLRTSFR